MRLAILALLALAQAGPVGATPEIPIVGTILDDVGRPVPGAEVVLAQGATAFNSGAWFASPDPERSAMLGRGRTDAEPSKPAHDPIPLTTPGSGVGFHRER